MNTQAFWKLTVALAPAAEEPVAALLERLFGQAPVIYTDTQMQKSWASVYLAHRADGCGPKRESLRAGLAALRAEGITLGSAAISLQYVRRKDWAESWKKHFKPMVIAGQLLVKPSWSQRQPASGQEVVVLDPGLSFGTGHHPTTRFCLEQLVRFRRQRVAPTFMDVGTGSGILAIAAAKLGYRKVVGGDNDPEAVRVARANARQNQVAAAVRLRQFDLNDLPVGFRQRFDLVCANLTSDLILKAQAALPGLVQPTGRLVLAGILRTEFDFVVETYRNAGWHLVARRTVGEWKSGAFQL